MDDGSSEDTRIIEHCELKRKVKVAKEYFTNTLNAEMILEGLIQSSVIETSFRSVFRRHD